MLRLEHLHDQGRLERQHLRLRLRALRLPVRLVKILTTPLKNLSEDISSLYAKRGFILLTFILSIFFAELASLFGFHMNMVPL